jgi:hypothetical protein
MWCELWGQPWGRIAMLIWKLCVWMSSQRVEIVFEGFSMKCRDWKRIGNDVM